jgi:hypothetical protein
VQVGGRNGDEEEDTDYGRQAPSIAIEKIRVERSIRESSILTVLNMSEMNSLNSNTQNERGDILTLKMSEVILTVNT